MLYTDKHPLKQRPLKDHDSYQIGSLVLPNYRGTLFQARSEKDNKSRPSRANAVPITHDRWDSMRVGHRYRLIDKTGGVSCHWLHRTVASSSPSQRFGFPLAVLVSL